MPVLDAAVVVDALVTVGPAGDRSRSELRGLNELQAPAILAAEVTSALRGLERSGALSPVRAVTALDEILSMRVITYPFGPFARRIWELRHNMTTYHAWYVALAEWLGTEFVTADKRLAGAVGARCPVRYLHM